MTKWHVRRRFWENTHLGFLLGCWLDERTAKREQRDWDAALKAAEATQSRDPQAIFLDQPPGLPAQRKVTDAPHHQSA